MSLSSSDLAADFSACVFLYISFCFGQSVCEICVDIFRGRTYPKNYAHFEGSAFCKYEIPDVKFCRISESFPLNDKSLPERFTSAVSNLGVSSGDCSLPHTIPSATTAKSSSIEAINIEKIREEELKIRKENEETMKRIREELAKEREAEERRLR